MFERNLLGRAFYASLGFEHLHRKIDDQTGFEVMRLRLAADPESPRRDSTQIRSAPDSRPG